jgi:hypothetical protein
LLITKALQSYAFVLLIQLLLVAADATTGRRIVVRLAKSGWLAGCICHAPASRAVWLGANPARSASCGGGLDSGLPHGASQSNVAGNTSPITIPVPSRPPRFLSNPPRISSPNENENENENENRFEPCHCLHRFRCTEITPLVVLELSSPSLSEAQYVEASMM